jgi:hypothetical protein
MRTSDNFFEALRSVFRRLASSFPVAARSVLPGTRLRLAVAAACGMGLLVAAGCNSRKLPPLGRVHGRVTLDGRPLAEAGVVFHPKGKGHESCAYTNDDGEYDLDYAPGVRGASAGEHSVRISRQMTRDPRSQVVPDKYNQETTLVFEVKAGEENAADFDLTSQ